MDDATEQSKKIAPRLCFLSVYNECQCEKQIRGFIIKRGLFIVLNRETWALHDA